MSKFKAPTLRQDLIEARSRATTAKNDLAKKYIRDETWNKDDEITSIEGLDSLVECVTMCLSYIPVQTYGSGAGSNGYASANANNHVNVVHATLNPDAGGTNRTHTCHVKVVRSDGHELMTHNNVYEIIEDAGQLLIMGIGIGGLIAAYKLSDVYGYWFDVKGNESANEDSTWNIQWEAIYKGKPLNDELSAMKIVNSGDRWSLQKILGPGTDAKLSSIGYLFTSAVEQITRV